MNTCFPFSESKIPQKIKKINSQQSELVQNRVSTWQACPQYLRSHQHYRSTHKTPCSGTSHSPQFLNDVDIVLIIMIPYTTRFIVNTHTHTQLFAWYQRKLSGDQTPVSVLKKKSLCNTTNCLQS